MYATSVIESEQSSLESHLGFTFDRHDPAYSWDVQEHLDSKKQRIRAEHPDIVLDSEVIRYLTREEQDFIRNERLLSSVDFHYFTRYCWLLPDASVSDGNLVRFEAWPSQQLILDEIARIEAEQYDNTKHGYPQDGCLIAVDKARQEGCSLLAAMLKMHRVTTSPYTLGITATENEEKRINLWKRDVRVWDRLPWWLKPERTAPDIQAVHLTFGRLESSVSYQDYSQKGSLAAGEQYIVGHMSELAQGDQTYVSGLMTLDYFPAIPQSWRSCHLLESTPAGMVGSWWYEFVMECLAGKGRWRVKFIPWYALGFKYIRRAPVNWTPAQATLEHAKKVELTSPEYMGRVVVLTRDQLYWWETTRDEHKRQGKLAVFLTNFCATITESFQSLASSIWDAETLDAYRTMTREPGGCYQILAL